MWAKFDPDMLRRIEQELRQSVEKALFSAWKSELDEDWDDYPRPAPMPFRYDAEIDGDE